MKGSVMAKAIGDEFYEGDYTGTVVSFCYELSQTGDRKFYMIQNHGGLHINVASIDALGIPHCYQTRFDLLDRVKLHIAGLLRTAIIKGLSLSWQESGSRVSYHVEDGNGTLHTYVREEDLLDWNPHHVT